MWLFLAEIPDFGQQLQALNLLVLLLPDVHRNTLQVRVTKSKHPVTVQDSRWPYWQMVTMISCVLDAAAVPETGGGLQGEQDDHEQRGHDHGPQPFLGWVFSRLQIRSCHEGVWDLHGHQLSQHCQNDDQVPGYPDLSSLLHDLANQASIWNGTVAIFWQQIGQFLHLVCCYESYSQIKREREIQECIKVTVNGTTSRWLHAWNVISEPLMSVNYVKIKYPKCQWEIEVKCQCCC